MKDQESTNSFEEIRRIESEIENLRAIQPLKLLRGWKEIRDALGLQGYSTQTVRRLARKHKIPVFYMGNKPTAMDLTIKIWMTSIQKIILGSGEEKRPDTF